MEMQDLVDVIPFALDETCPLSLTRGISWLSADEIDRADRFRFPHLRERYIRGRAMLRACLAKRLSVAPSELTFVTGAHGKPSLSGNALEFNLSHSEDRAVLAIGTVRGIGADLERFDREVDIDGLARRCFLDTEIHWMNEAVGDERQKAFFWIWTAKEARMKATGEGFQLAPKRIELAFRGRRPDRILSPETPPAFLHSVSLDEGVACHVVALEPFRYRVIEPETL